MKSLLLMVAFAFSATALNAQNWTVTNEKTDKGGWYASYEYHVDYVGTVTFYVGKLSFLMFNRLDGNLDDAPCTVLGFGKRGTPVKAELYDNFGNLLTSYDLWLWKLDFLKAAAETRSHKSTVKRIVSHLKNRKGKVRLVFPKDNYGFVIEPMTV